MKLIDSSIQGQKNLYGKFYGGVTVTLKGRTPFTRKTITRQVWVRAKGTETRRQILKAAAKKTGRFWNIPFFP